MRFSFTALFYSKRRRRCRDILRLTSWGCVSAIDSNGRTIWIADAHRDDGKRFVVRADEKLTAFVELESVIRGYDKFCLPFFEPPAQCRRNIESQSVSCGSVSMQKKSGNAGAQKKE